MSNKDRVSAVVVEEAKKKVAREVLDSMASF